jgi:stearoyl-CoA desaturase (delta-9 desaturase)
MTNVNLEKAGNVLRTYEPAIIGVTAMLATTSVFLHRAETHGSLKLKPVPRMAARAITWVGSGMKPREWVGVHIRHHKYTDQAPDPDIPKSGDPHSPFQNGRFGVLKVLVGNVPMYRKAARELEPGDYPPELNQDKWDKRLFDKGILGLGVLAGIYLAAKKGDAKTAGKNWAAHVVAVMAAGGVINGLSHAGNGPMVDALVNGPKADEDGNYARNLSDVPTVGTMGEGSHKNHHEDPSNIWFNEKHWLDPGGMIAAASIKNGLAEAGTKPPTDVAA